MPLTNLHDNLQPLGRILNMTAEGMTVWDCSPIMGPDGLVHVFYACRPSPDRPDATWYLGGSILHAAAERPEGPYTARGTVRQAGAAAGVDEDRWDGSGLINPNVFKHPDGYGLVYTGCSRRRHDTQAVGMLTAPDLNGPWSPVADGPIIASEPDRSGPDGYLCNNPAPVICPDGRLRIYYKGRNVRGTGDDGGPLPGPMTICLAVAGRTWAEFHKHPANPVVALDRSVEDPFVWHDGEVFRMLVSELGCTDPGGSLLQSPDGLTWSEPVPGYPAAEHLTGNRQRLEEPNLLFVGGAATHLFNVLGACAEDNVYSGFVSLIGADADAPR